MRTLYVQMNGETSHFLPENGTMEGEITTAMEEEERAIHEETSKEQQEMMQKVTTPV